MLAKPLIHKRLTTDGRAGVPDVAVLGLVEADEHDHHSRFIREPTDDPYGDLLVEGMTDPPQFVPARLAYALERRRIVDRLLLEILVHA
jgi:hypothetical protein